MADSPATTTPTPSTEASVPGSRGATLYPEIAAKETGASAPAAPAPAAPSGEQSSATEGAAAEPSADATAASTSGAGAEGEAAEAKTEEKVEAKPEGEEKPSEEPPTLTLDSYKDLKVPETITSDSALIAEFKDMALADNLPPEAAQKYVNLFEKTLTTTVESLAKAQQEAFTKTTEGWLSESLALPEFQGEREATTKAFLSQLVEEFGSPEAAQILAATGAGNHPAVVKYILSLGQALIEGEPTGAPGVVVPGKPNGQRTLGEVLYQPRNS